MLANFSIPSQILLPFIKDSLGNHGEGSYDYLKGLVLSKKDVE